MIEQLVKRRLIVGLAVFLVLSLGLITLSQLPRREIPVIQHPIATVDTLYPGASAGQVESYITDKLEASFSEIPGIKEVTSTSQAGFSQITITVEDNKNQDQVWNKVQQKINQVQAEFPDGAGAPSLHTDLQLQGVAIYQLVADQEEDLLSLEDWLDPWESAFRQVPGVVRVQIQGLSERELLLRADPQKLAAFGLSPAQLTTMIQREINPVPPGQWTMEEKMYRLHFSAKEPDKLLQIPLGANSTGHTIYLKDVATLEKVYPPRREIVTYEGKPAVSLSFFASNEKDLLKIDSQLRGLIQEMEQELPEEIELVQVYSQADPIQRMFQDLGISFILAMLFVLLTTSAGLNAFASIGAGLSIPMAFCGGILVLPWAGVDMNQITLIAFILVLGDLVDNAIVVNENIARHMAGGMLHIEAIRAGTGEVAPSIVSATLIITATFFPLLFLSGTSGDFIRPLPVVIISCIGASAIAALVFIPVYRIRFDRYLQHREAHFQSGWLHKQLEQAGDFYSRKIVSRLLKAPLKYAAGGLLISLLAFGLVKIIPVEFFPDVEREELFVEIEFHPSTAQARGQDKVAQIRDFVSGQEGVRQVNTYYGTAMPRIFGMSTSSASGLDSAHMLVFVDSRQVNARQVRDALSQGLGEAFPQERFSLSVVESGPPVGAPLALRIEGDSLEELQGASDELRQAFLSQAGVLSVKDDIGQAIPRIVFQPLPEAMALHDVNARQINQALGLYGEGIDLGEVHDGNNLIDLRLQYGRELKGISQDGQQILVFNEKNQAVPLSAVARPLTDLDLPGIPHHNYQRSNTIRAYLESGSSPDQVLASANPAIQAIMDQYPRLNLEVEGETAARDEVFVEMGKIFLVVLLLILIIIAVQFNSLALAVLILTTVVFSSSGALYSLFITRTPLGFMSLMGVISLAGIVVRNGIILIEFMEAKLQDGVRLEEAIRESCRQRLRPVLLTSATTFFGLMPVVFGKSLLFKPLAICIAGGLVYSTFLTLLIMPSLYYLWKNKV